MAPGQMAHGSRFSRTGSTQEYETGRVVKKSIIPKKWGRVVEERMREVVQEEGTQKETNEGLRIRECSVRA